LFDEIRLVLQFNFVFTKHRAKTLIYFDDKSDFIKFWSYSKDYILNCELHLENEIHIFNLLNNKIDKIRTDDGGMLGSNRHLRNGLVDSLGLCGRQRHLALTIKDNINLTGINNHIFESNTPLSNLLISDFNFTVSSYWVSKERPSYLDSSVKFLDLLNLDLRDNFYDTFVHSDCLEHIYDYEKSLSECYKKLRRGGKLIFSVPLFAMPDTNIRARYIKSELVLLQDAEWHGDIGSQGPILAFYNFGLDLFDNILAAGFSKVMIAYCHNPLLGLFSDNHPDWLWRMPPISIIAIK
jgi:hypothetical protein